MMYIMINGKKKPFGQKKVQKMYETLLLIQRGLKSGHIEDASLIEPAKPGAKSLDIIPLSEVVAKTLK